MARDTRGPTLRVDADGVRTQRLPGVRRGVWVVVLAIGIASVALLVLVRRAPDGVSGERAAAPASAPLVAASDARAPARPAPARAVEPRRPAAPAPAVPAAVPHAPAAPTDQMEPPSRDDQVFGQADPSEPSGIALFPPPGTKPIKRGIVVPEGFELPPGYVRHYQATDDGERVPAILMFHPDYHPVDEQGEPIALPADRVVPPDMAPPGMPVQLLELPEEQGVRDAAP